MDRTDMKPDSTPTAAAGGSPRGAKQPVDPRARTLAISLELAKNAVRARTLDELQFILVNDTRALLPFDRASLIVHSYGESRPAATNNQPQLKEKSDFVRRLSKLAPRLKEMTKALVLVSRDLKLADIPRETAEAIRDYVEHAGCSFLMVVPLVVHDRPIGHLLVETFDDGRPSDVEILALVNMVPFFSIALSQKLFLAGGKGVRRTFEKAIGKTDSERARFSTWKRAAIIAGIAILFVLGLASPVGLQVGGEASVVPEYEYFAFVRMDGIVDHVLVKEGERVTKGATLATLDPRDLDFKIRKAQRLVSSYNAELEILRSMGVEDSSKLAESRLVLIKRKRAEQEMAFLQRSKRFLRVLAPADGLVLGENLKSLVGKKFKAGEAFCSVAPFESLEVEILVRDSDVSYVKPGQTATVFFNFRPGVGRLLKVKSISPRSEVVVGMGNVFKVKARFVERLEGLKPGMKGIAHIDAGRASLWFVLTRRIREKLNQAMLAF